MASVSLAGVTKCYPGGVRAVDRVDLEIEDQEFLVLLGPSGCGKTSLLRLIAGLDQPTEGIIRLDGREANRLSPKERDVAMVFQGHALYPHLNVYRNLAFGLNLRQSHGGWKSAVARWLQPSLARQRRAQIDQQIRAAARQLGIEGLLDRLPRELSGGERQRVALGRALVRRPAVSLLDEPLSNLDAPLRSLLRRDLKVLHHERPGTVLYVTHDQAEALTLGDRIAVMHAGGIVQVGPPLELYDWPKNRFVATFLGSPGMNFLSGELATIGDSINFVGQGGTIPLDKLAASRVQHYIGRSVWLGIRPEHVRVGSDSTGAALAGRALAVESLGDHCVVHLELEAFAGRLTVKTCRRLPVHPGERVPVGFDCQKMYVFDPDTGENVTIRA